MVCILQKVGLHDSTSVSWYRSLHAGFMVALTLLGSGQSDARSAPRRGVSEALARERAAAVRDLRYDLVLRDARRSRRPPVPRPGVVRLALSGPAAASSSISRSRASRLRAVRARRARDAAVESSTATSSCPPSHAGRGERASQFEFVAGDEALNRNDEFLYTLFVPARARLAFPCFDQPDLKARYTLSLDVPAGWQAVANGADVGRGRRARRRHDDARRSPKRSRCRPICSRSSPAGSRSRPPSATAASCGCSIARPTPPRWRATATRSSTCTRAALAWLEDYTGIPYPFGKFDFVLIPSFQFGGMEHAGAILYNASGLHARRVGDAEPAARARQRDRARDRAHVVRRSRHDAVVQRRVDEGGVRQLHGGEDREPVVPAGEPRAALPAGALSRRRTRWIAPPAPTPIRQPLGNLDEAGQMYGPIIYQKAPIVMRQLEMIVGEPAFRDGLREYLKTLRVRQRDVARPGAHPRRAHAARTSRRGAARGWRSAAGRSSRPACG